MERQTFDLNISDISSYVPLDTLLEETNLLSSKLLERDREESVACKVNKFSSAEEFRKSPPEVDCVILDLSSCTDLLDEDLADKRHRYPLLESIDVSNCDKLTGKGLPKFLQRNIRCKRVAMSAHCRQVDFPTVRELTLHIDFTSWDSAVVKCSALEKLHIKCKGDVDTIKLLVLLWQISRHSPKCVELNVHLTPEVFKKQSKEIPATITHALPYCTFCLIEYDEKEKKVEEKKNSAIAEAIQQLTHAQPNTFEADILQGFQEAKFTDITFTVKNSQQITAHKVVLEYRCPKLLQQTHFPDISGEVFRLFLSFLYSDLVCLPVSNGSSTGPQYKYGVVFPSSQALQELNSLANQFQLERLRSICMLLFTAAEGGGDISLVEAIPPTTLTRDISTSEANKNFHDISILAKEREFPANKRMKVVNSPATASRFILTSRCPYFKRLFSSGMKDARMTQLQLNEVSGEALNVILHYLYTDRLAFDPEFVCEVYVIADMMQLIDLKVKCIQSVKDNLSIENDILVAKQSYIFSADEISEIAFQFFTNNADSLFKSPELLDLDWTLLQVFLAHIYNYLLEENNDETNTARLQCQILKCVLKWTMMRSKVTDHLSQSQSNRILKDGEKYVYNDIHMPVLRERLECILRYLTTLRLSSVDFANCLIDSGIFPKNLVSQTFSGLGVVLDMDEIMDDSDSNTKTQHDRPQKCAHCSNWGYFKITVPCACYHTGIFCGWCHNTGSTSKIGDPCDYCDPGQVIKLKFLFDKKLLEECIRTPVEPNSIEKRRELQFQIFETEQVLFPENVMTL